MGANPWSNFVPYQPTVSQALYTLQQQLFESGYYWVRDWSGMILEMMLPPDYDEWMDAKDIEHSKMLLERRLNGPPPSTIDELRDWNAEEGIGSILDMLRVDSIQAYGTVSPLTDAQLLDLYGTTKPSHEQIEQVKQMYRTYRKRGEGLYNHCCSFVEPVDTVYGAYLMLFGRKCSQRGGDQAAI